MAELRFDGFVDYQDYIDKVGTLPDNILRRMVNAGASIVLKAVKAAMPKFAPYAQKTTAKKSRYGGQYAVITFRGETKHNTPANIAAYVYERGRKAREAKGKRRAVAEQPARPWLAQVTESVHEQVNDEMDRVLDEYIKGQES